MNKKSKEIHIGERIKEIFYQKNISITRFADLLHCDRANVYNIFRRKTIDIYLLLKISEILNHNLVEEFCVRQGLSQGIATSKISFVLEINLVDDKTLKCFLKAIKQLGIRTIGEMEK